MSINTKNRMIALDALKLFERIPEKRLKDYRNAVQKAMLLLGTQGLKRMVLYISSQMGKDEGKDEKEKKAWELLYGHLASFTDIAVGTFQYEIVFELKKEQAALKEESFAFFLLCLKRLVNGKLTEQEPPLKKDLVTKREDPETESSNA
ncbi:MAG: hypothetical protein H6556_23855 [Lewinellaceae bacterium]|nr:hypothetical protein [Lewinellaceae bacterium]